MNQHHQHHPHQHQQQRLLLNRNLQNAIIMKRADQVYSYLQQGADVNAACPLNGNNTPLHTACKNVKTAAYYHHHDDDNNHTRNNDTVDVEALIVDILLHYGADVHLRNVLFETPLHTVCRYAGSPSLSCSIIIKLLVEKGGADLKHVHNATSFEGFTPLHLVCCVPSLSSRSPRIHQWNIVKYLLQQGAPVNARNPPPPLVPAAQSPPPPSSLITTTTRTTTTEDKIRKTPLLVAAARDTEGSVMQELLAAGADIFAQDENGRTAADVAASVASSSSSSSSPPSSPPSSSRSPSSLRLVEKLRNTAHVVQACLDNDKERIKALCWNCDNFFLHVSIIKPESGKEDKGGSTNVEAKDNDRDDCPHLALPTETLFAFVCRHEIHEAILALALRGGADYGNYTSDRSITLHWPVILVRWYLEREKVSEDGNVRLV